MSTNGAIPNSFGSSGSDGGSGSFGGSGSASGTSFTVIVIDSLSFKESAVANTSNV